MASLGGVDCPWHDLVGRDEGEEEGSKDEETTLFKERGESFGMTVADNLEVTAVDKDGPGAKAGVQVGDKVLSAAGAELEEGVFDDAMEQMEGESGILADETMHRGFSTAWVGIELELKCRKRKAEDGGREGGGLKEVLQTGWELLMAGLEAKGLKEAAKRIPLASFDRVMAGVHAASWEVETLPSPLGMYIQALEHADEGTQQCAVQALQPIVGTVLAGDDERQHEVAMKAGDLIAGWVVLPRMSAQALFKTTASLELSEEPNCEVALAMGEGGLEAVVMATKDIAAGEALTVGASGGPGDEDSDDMHHGNDIDDSDDDAPPALRVRGEE